MTSPIPNLLANRHDWMALPPREPGSELTLPVRNVLFHATGTEPCMKKADCEQAMLMLQKQHMDQGLSDIKYNYCCKYADSFLVGGDGKLYEGRGWNKQPERSEMYPEIHGSSINIAFFGRKGVRPLKEETTVSKAFMKFAAEKGHITENPTFYAEI